MFGNTSEWWEALSILQKIYWIIAIPFTIFFIIQLILTFFGGDTPDDAHADYDVEHDTGFSFQFFTLKNMVAFFTIFSWVGIACLDDGMGEGTSILISTISGLLMMAIMSTLLYFMGRMADSGTMDIQNAIGGIGQVYLTIKARNGNVGQVQVKVQGALRTLDAITNDENDLPTGSVIKVVAVKESILVVTKNL